MSDILQFIMVNALHAAALCFLFAMLFLHSPQRRGLRLFTVLIGVAAMVLPSLLVPRTLGYPDPWPQNGVYDVLGWAANESQGDIYLFVEQTSEPIPRHVKVPFDLDVALALEKVHVDLSVREKLSVQIQMGPGLPTPGYHLLRREQGDRSERSPRQDVFKRLATTPYHVLLAIYVGCISMMILAIFVPRRGLRAIGAIAGAVSLWLPLFIQLNTLGTPNSHPPKGDYQLLASKLSPSGESLYVLGAFLLEQRIVN